jgi:TonB family protein
MTLRVLLVALLLLGAAVAQQDEPVVLSGEGHPPICHSKTTDAPGCVTAPHTTYAPDPKYPEKARKARDRGNVVLQLVVSPDGLPRDIKVDRGLTPDLDKAALDAVKGWQFAPATRDGHPVAARIKVEVSFRLY